MNQIQISKYPNGQKQVFLKTPEFSSYFLLGIEAEIVLNKLTTF